MKCKPVCPGCAATFKEVPIENIGKKVICPKCKTKFTITENKEIVASSELAKGTKIIKLEKTTGNKTKTYQASQSKLEKRQRPDSGTRIAKDKSQTKRTHQQSISKEKVEQKQNNKTFSKRVVAIVISGIAIGIVGWWFFLKTPGPPSGYKDYNFGSSRYEFPEMQPMDAETLVEPAESYIAYIDKQPARNLVENFERMIQVTNLSANFTFLRLSPLFFYEMYRNNDDDKTFLGQKLSDILYGFTDDKFSYVRIYPADVDANLKIIEKLTKKYGDPTADLPPYPTPLSLSTQWSWEGKEITIRCITPHIQKIDIPEQVKDSLQLYEVPDEFSKPFIEFFGDSLFLSSFKKRE